MSPLPFPRLCLPSVRDDVGLRRERKKKREKEADALAVDCARDSLRGRRNKKKERKNKRKAGSRIGEKRGERSRGERSDIEYFSFFPRLPAPSPCSLSLSPSSPRTRILIFRNSSRDAGERARKAHRPRRSGETRRIGEGRSSVRTTHDRGGDGHLRARASERIHVVHESALKQA